ARPEDRDRVDLSGMVVVPGLVNTHVHLAQSLLRGCADEFEMPAWLLERVWPLQGSYDAEDGRVSAELGMLEMVKSGTTTFLETFLATHYGFDGIAQVVVDAGVRAGLSKIVMDIPGYTQGEHQMHPGMVEDREASFNEAVEMHERWNGAADGRLSIWFGPRPPGGSSRRVFEDMMAIARERGMRVDMHLAEELNRVEYIREHYNGASPIDFCEQVGMLGPDVVLVHCVNITSERDIERMAASGTHVSHNPVSNAKLGMGVAPVPAFLRAGVNVTIATDGGPANNGYDMIRDLRWVAALHKMTERDTTVLPAEQVLEMATLGGARAMGLGDEVGQLTPGKKADFVAVDFDKPHLVPALDPVSTLVYCASGQDVDTVVVDGRVLVRGGEALTLDEERILFDARRHAERVYERAGVKVASRWPVVEATA
ncbi:MAG TPA: amidohydrolase, partial [Conexibacter sp.]|nr:amidohydrolase [Conexibacter sp.]